MFPTNHHKNEIKRLNWLRNNVTIIYAIMLSKPAKAEPVDFTGIE